MEMPLTMTETQTKMLEEKSELLKALAHPVRLCIVRNLLETGGCNVSKMQGCLSMPQSTISQHLGKLKSAGIIEGKRSGTEITYCLINTDVVNIVRTLIPELPKEE